jgi:hypothetical protein
MKKKLFLLSVIFLITLLFFNCEQPSSSSGGGSSGGSSSTDPFAGILYRDMVAITGGTYTQFDGTSGFVHTISNFLLGKYEVTYELWYTVYQWAISNGYTFANAGREGNDGTIGVAPTSAKYEPVTYINWRDAIVGSCTLLGNHFY